MKRIDDWIFDSVFEPFAHGFQKLTGKDNFFLAHCCSLIAWITILVVAIIEEKGVPVAATIILGFISLFFYTGVVLFKSRYEKVEARQRKPNALRNDIESRARIKKLFVSIVLVVIFFVVFPQFRRVALIFEFFITGFEYFTACTPLPPCRGKIRDFISR